METCFTAIMESEMDTSMEDEVESGILQWFTSYLDTQNVRTNGSWENNLGSKLSSCVVHVRSLNQVRFADG